MPAEIHRHVPYGLWNGVPHMGYPYLQRDAKQRPQSPTALVNPAEPHAVAWRISGAGFRDRYRSCCIWNQPETRSRNGREWWKENFHSAGSKENYYPMLFNWFIWNALRSHRKLLLLHNWWAGRQAGGDCAECILNPEHGDPVPAPAAE